ncbi:MAG: alpha/beta hydrolase [Cyanobacteria bacterium J069]|nr:MAG: alpha/beta hydrolase [Cyanobacteria bacterium J069]
MALAVGAGLLGQAAPASAAESVVVSFGPLSRSFSVAELRSLADTGEASSKLRWYLNTAGVRPAAMQTLLSQKAPVPLEFADQVLNSLPGEFGLFQLGQLVGPSGRAASLQAMRAALVLSAADDNQISLIEVLENYPTQRLYVDGLGLLRTARDLQDLMSGAEGSFEAIASALENLVPGLFCDCEPNAAGGAGDRPDASVESATNCR